VRILALETTESIGTVAAFDGQRLLAESSLNAAQRSAQSLAPAIKQLWKTVGWQPRDVQLIAVTIGPGSFTGLRVGVTTAKTLAYAVGAEVIGIGTLEAIAARAPAEVRNLVAAIDAQRQQVFTARLIRDADGAFHRQGEVAIVDSQAWLQSLAAGDAATGPALRKLGGSIPPGVRLIDESLWAPTASAVGQLALRRYATGERDDLWRLAPLYYRKSAAEEKWDKRIEGEDRGSSAAE